MENTECGNHHIGIIQTNALRLHYTKGVLTYNRSFPDSQVVMCVAWITKGMLNGAAPLKAGQISRENPGKNFSERRKFDPVFVHVGKRAILFKIPMEGKSLFLHPPSCAAANNNRSNGKVEKKACHVGSRSDHGATCDGRIDSKKIQRDRKQDPNQIGNEDKSRRG